MVTVGNHRALVAGEPPFIICPRRATRAWSPSRLSAWRSAADYMIVVREVPSHPVRLASNGSPSISLTAGQSPLVIERPEDEPPFPSDVARTCLPDAVAWSPRQPTQLTHRPQCGLERAGFSAVGPGPPQDMPHCGPRPVPEWSIFVRGRPCPSRRFGPFRSDHRSPTVSDPLCRCRPAETCPVARPFPSSLISPFRRPSARARIQTQ